MATEKRLVYAEEVMALICGMDSLPWEESAQEMVESLTTVDAVEVVRCRDCTYYIEDQYGSVCYFHSQIESEDYPAFQVAMLPWDFCSYGERKDNA